MTLQQLKYMITVAEKGSITEAAKTLYISQPSLSEAIKEVEKEAGITIFIRRRSGAVPTKEGMEFLGYARQVLEQMDILNSRYIDYGTAKQRFCVSTQHYTFTANAFVELVRKYSHEHYEFILNETQTHQIIEDVRNRFSDLGILFLSSVLCADYLMNTALILLSFLQQNRMFLYQRSIRLQKTGRLHSKCLRLIQSSALYRAFMNPPALRKSFLAICPLKKA